MSLRTGIYTITSHFGGFPVGVEQHDPRPVKQVVTLPKDDRAVQWRIVKKDDRNTYEISIAGGVVTNVDDVATVVPEEEAEAKEWTIEAQAHQGSDLYTIIFRNGQGQGWFITEEGPSNPVGVRHLIVAPSLPPFFIPNELFKIVAIDE